MNVGVISYSLGGTGFLLLTVLLATSWKGKLQGGMLVVASSVSAIWNYIQAYEAATLKMSAPLLAAIDAIKITVWIIFLLGLFRDYKQKLFPAWVYHVIHTFCFLIIVYGLLVYVLEKQATLQSYHYSNLLYAVLLLSLIGLILVEQLYRNTRSEQLWAIKYLFFSVAGIFVYDIFLYSNNILFYEVNIELLEARGGVYALLVPLIAVSAARNPQWSLGVHVSRNIVFYTASMVGVGIYFLVISISGYYIKLYGGGWGTFVQILFVTTAGIFMLTLVFSGHVRARVKQFIGVHFYSYKYDYREEWLRLMRILSATHNEDMPLQQRVIKAVAQIVESPGGGLWIITENKLYIPVATWNMHVTDDSIVSEDDSLIHLLKSNQFVIDVREYKRDPFKYENVELPKWLLNLDKAWLIIPLVLDDGLYGFLVLLQSIGMAEQSWEDGELLRTVGLQAASYLAQHDAAQKLAETRQFDAFNRLSAYVVHDLKNVTAQLGLVVANSARHKGNPEFMADTINTVESATQRMNRMLAQLRKSRFQDDNVSRVSLNMLLKNVVENRKHELPIPVLKLPDEVVYLDVDAERMGSVIGHLIQNAQEATNSDGEIIVSMLVEEYIAIIISDTGHGMDKEFIHKRLFRPFDTTKGNAGMGIGVYESRDFINRLGGVIVVDSELGNGTKFTIRIPRIKQRYSVDKEDRGGHSIG